MLIAAPGWHFADHLAEDHATGPGHRATHGHLPDDPRLMAAFAAAGPGVAEGARVGPLDALDVAPTLVALLGVALPAAVRGPALAMLGPSALTTRPAWAPPGHRSFTRRSSGCNTTSLRCFPR